MSERTYTESELAAEKAALLREVKESILDASWIPLNTRHEFIRALTRSTDQSALARVEAAAYARAKRDAKEAATSNRNRFEIEQAIDALQDRGREAEK